MRQIVQIDKPIVQKDDGLEKSRASITGRAQARAWDGEPTQIEWNLDCAIGFLLVTEGQIEAECAAGNKTLLNRGDLLIMNESSVAHAAFFLEGSAHVRDDDLLTSAQNKAHATISSALHGAIRPHHAHWHARPFAHNPARAMAVAHLNEREFARAATLARLLVDETAAAPVGNTDAARLIAAMEASLFEALVGVLRERDPMSMPQLAGSNDIRLQRALLAMIDAPEKPWRIETMAREAAMSRTTFAVRFKEVLGQTPLNYLTALRIQYAMTLLAATPQQTIDSVARDVGYADESALRRAYERAVGEPLKRNSA
jgi:transcriptional regulator GlxA family with amidase domain